MHGMKEYDIIRRQQAEEVQKAARRELAHQLRIGQVRVRPNLYRTSGIVLTRIGAQMVKWGERMQSRQRQINVDLAALTHKDEGWQSA